MGQSSHNGEIPGQLDIYECIELSLREDGPVHQQKEKVMAPSPNAAKELEALIGDPEVGLFEAEEMMGDTDCAEGCVVEPDGVCPHGFQSAGITLGVV